MKKTIIYPLFIGIILFQTNCTAPESNQSNVEPVVDIPTANDELLNKGNIDIADSIFSADYGNNGPEGIKSMVSGLREAFPDLQVSIDNMVSEGNMVAWTRTHKGTFSKPFYGYFPTGEEISWKTMVVTRYDEDGKIAEEWGINNLFEKLDNPNKYEGTFEYLPPIKGRASLKNGFFNWIFSNENDPETVTSEYGTYYMNDEGLITAKIEFSTNSEAIGTMGSWKITGWEGDTVRWESYDESMEVVGGGSALKIGN